MTDKSLIGHKLGTFDVDVEKGRLRFFAKVIGETNPIYSDEAAARAAGHPGLPMPPTFLFCLAGEGIDRASLLKLLNWDLGRILHAEQSFTYHKMAYAGDVLTFQTEVADLYEKKGGALQFMVQQTRVTNQHGEHVADIRCSLVQR